VAIAKIKAAMALIQRGLFVFIGKVPPKANSTLLAGKQETVQSFRCENSGDPKIFQQAI
jgi:hypothetical protein